MGDILSLMGYVQDQGEKGRARGLSQLIGKAYNAPPDQRQAVLGQVANVDGGMAMDAQKAFGEQDEAVHDQIIKRAAMVASLYKQNPQMAQAAYQGLPELAARGGFGQVPPQLDDKVAAALDSMVQAARQSGTGGNVQSTYIDDKGQRVAIMRDGSVQVLGANAPNNQIIDTGNGFFGVNKGNLQAAPVMTGGQAAPQQQRAPGEVPFSIDPSLPPEVQADIRANEAKYAQAPDGADIGIGGGGSAPMGGQLTSAPKPGDIRADRSQALQMADMAAKQNRTLTPQEVAARGMAPGTVAQEDGYGNVKVIQAPTAQQGQRLSATALRQVNSAKAKMIDLQAVKNQLALVQQKFAPLKDSMAAGPFGGGLLPTEDGKRYDAAVSLLQQFVRKLTRTPGEGSMSDWEGKLAMLANPSRNDYESVTQDKIDQLNSLVNQIEQGYQSLLQDNQADITGPQQPAQRQNGASHDPLGIL